MSNNLISTIQSNLSYSIPTIEVLNISSNFLKELNDSNFNLPNLLKLDLKNNLIHYVSEKCFCGLNKLQYLDISMNKISSVFPSTFQYLTGLIQLIISNNQDLSSQDFGLLLASRRLKIVNASRTNQKKIPSSLTRSVRYLILSFNKIRQVQCGDLDSYPLLNSLDMSSNNISSIEDDALGRLELLTTIILNNNSLNSVPVTLPNNLKHLNLRKNFISQITSMDFMGLSQLKQLDLSQNNITIISEGSFSQMFGLQKLNLSHNNIHVVSTSILNGPQNLKVLDLSYLINVTKCNQALCFPVPEKNELQQLYLENSPLLAKRLMNDAAALKTFKELDTLNLAMQFI
uniref:Uncharacterized protein n=1 Tax=Rhodnius prolixus TaxID=13249 RepID=T1HAN0_RHOPR